MHALSQVQPGAELLSSSIDVRPLQGTLREWLGLARAPQPHIRLYALATILDQSINNLFTANVTLLQQASLSPKQITYLQSPPWNQIDAAINCIDQHHWKIITLGSSDYPPLLKHIVDPPLVLFADGNWQLLSRNQLAMVGSRNPSADGIELAQHFAKTLADHGVVITSGLAHGIDGASHRGALNSNHPHTIAVIATGLDQCYPKTHQQLADQIREQDGWQP